MLLSRISLLRVRYAAKNCVQQRFPTFNYNRLFIRDSGHGVTLDRCFVPSDWRGLFSVPCPQVTAKSKVFSGDRRRLRLCVMSCYPCAVWQDIDPGGPFPTGDRFRRI